MALGYFFVRPARLRMRRGRPCSAARRVRSDGGNSIMMPNEYNRPEAEVGCGSEQLMTNAKLPTAIDALLGPQPRSYQALDAAR